MKRIGKTRRDSDWWDTNVSTIGHGPKVILFSADPGPGQLRFLPNKANSKPIVANWVFHEKLSIGGSLYFDAVFLGRTHFLGIWKFLGQETYIHFVVQETRIIRKLFIFNYFIKKRRNRQFKSCIFYWN